jgi:hypothetical protein
MTQDVTKFLPATSFPGSAPFSPLLQPNEPLRIFSSIDFWEVLFRRELSGPQS